MFLGINVSLVGKLRSSVAFYAANDIAPSLVLDAGLGYYQEDFTPSQLTDIVTHTRASGATYLDSTGTLQTAASGEIRNQAYTYVDGVLTGPYIQLESAAATNLVTYSQDFTNAAWIKARSSVTSSSETSPDGFSNFDLWQEDSTASTSHYVFDGYSVVSGSQYTKSVFIKKSGRNAAIAFFSTNSAFASGVAYFDLDAGTVSATDAGIDHANIESFGGGVYRISATATAISNATGNVGIAGQIGNSLLYSGDGTSGFYIWGAQFEQGSIPTSYIPTSGSTATCAAETLTIPNPPWPSGSPGSRGLAIAMDGLMTYADTGGVASILFDWEKDANNQITIFLQTASANTGRQDFLQYSGGVIDIVVGVGVQYSPGINVPFSIASRHGDNFINGAVDGTALTANLTPTILPDLSSTPIQIGSAFNGFIDTLRIWDVDLTDAGIAEASS